MTGSQTPSACLMPGLCWAWDYRGEADSKPHSVVSEDWVLGSAQPPGLPRAECLPALVFSSLRIREAPGLSGRECMWDLEKEFILHILCPGPKTWVGLLASFAPSALQTEELLLTSLNLFPSL